MSTHKKIDAICIAAIIFSIVLTVLLMNGKVFASIPVMSEDVGSDLFSANDLNADWDTAYATKIVLSDEGSTISGNGAYVFDGNVCIAYAGHYVLSGELTNGSVIIDADKKDKIWVLLDGVSIHCDDDAAIRVEQADHVFLTLADGKENIISSGEEYNEEAASSGVDGTIYSRDDLTINGTGTLTVSAEYHHGIVCNDDLVVAGGNIAISAAQDGIHANDSVRIQNAEIFIKAGDDGITVSNDDETAFLYVGSGSITISESYEGLEAVDITIAGGTVDIMATDDGINASGRGENSVIRITDGDVTIVNPSGRDADGLDSNGSIYIEGGRVFISVSDTGGNCALDCGSENGGECVVSGGTVIACGGSAMAEGFAADSAQGFLMYGTTAAAGTIISLEDSDDRELLSEEIPCSFSSVVLSTPELKVGDVCTITIDGVQEQITIDNSSSSGFGQGGMFRGGMPNGRNFGGMTRGEDVPVMGRIEPPEDGEVSGDIETPERMEQPNRAKDFDRLDMPDDESGMVLPDGDSGTDRQEMRGAGGRQFASEAGQDRKDGARFRQQDMDRGQMRPGEDISSSAVSVDTLVMLGISVLVLLAGLCIAAKVKH